MFGYRKSKLMALLAALSGILLMASVALGAQNIRTNWVDQLALLPGNNVLTAVYDSDLAGLKITSSDTGDVGPVGMGLQVPPNFEVMGVRVCYEVHNTTGSLTFITEISISQVQNPPTSTLVLLLDDKTDQPSPGPVCVETTPAAKLVPHILPSQGALLLNLQLHFASTDDYIVIRGLALKLKVKGTA